MFTLLTKTQRWHSGLWLWLILVNLVNWTSQNMISHAQMKQSINPYLAPITVLSISYLQIAQYLHNQICSIDMIFCILTINKSLVTNLSQSFCLKAFTPPSQESSQWEWRRRWVKYGQRSRRQNSHGLIKAQWLPKITVSLLTISTSHVLAT